MFGEQNKTTQLIEKVHYLYALLCSIGIFASQRNKNRTNGSQLLLCTVNFKEKLIITGSLYEMNPY